MKKSYSLNFVLLGFIKGIIMLFLIALVSARTNAQQAGTVDLNFNPTDVGYGYGNGASATVLKSFVQADGKIIIGGHFGRYNRTSRNGIARLNSDGFLDTSFNPGTGTGENARLETFEVQKDGKILIGGDFTSYNGVSRKKLARVNVDGTLDPSFDPGISTDGKVEAIAVQSDGKIIVGGWFSNYNGISRNGIARLNSDGSLDTSFDPGTGTGDIKIVHAILLQDDGKIVIGGYFSSYNGISRNGIARINPDGSLDTSFNPGTGIGDYKSIYTMILQADKKIIIGGNFNSFNGTACNKILRLNPNGTIDASFSSGTGSVNSVETLLLQPDGKIIIGGSFQSFNGFLRNNIARLHTDGSLDTSFGNGTAANGNVFTLALQLDGKIIIGGGFTSYDGKERYCITRLNANGSLDNTLNPVTGANHNVFNILVQLDGKIVIGGDFTSYNDFASNNIARLNTDGTIDTSFKIGFGANGRVRALTMQSDGKTIIGGHFLNYNGQYVGRIARLNSDGTLDTTFNPGSGANNNIYTTILQSDGKIIIGGTFTSFDGIPRNRIARLNSDGSLDTSFDPGKGAEYDSWNPAVHSIAMQMDGKIIIVGAFRSYNDISRNRIARLNSDGTLDLSFNPGAGTNAAIYTVAMHSDGKIIIGGDFTSYNGTPRNRIARINSDGTLDATFSPSTGGNNTVLTSSIQPDGKVIIGGDFTSYDGFPLNRIGRLNVDGTLDASFSSGMGVDRTVWTTTLQSDSKIIIGGAFTSYDSTGRNRISRIHGMESTTAADKPLERLIKLYPNPTSGLVNIDLGIFKEKPVTVELYNMMGKLAFRRQITTDHSTGLNLNGLNGGYYTVRIMIDKQVFVQKLLINR